MNKTKLQNLENNLWSAAVYLRGHLSAEDYMHVVIGIIVLKYINDKYDIAIKKLKEEDGLDISDIDENDIKGKGAILVPEKSKWKVIMSKVGTPEIGDTIDDALIELSKENPDLAGVFNTQYKSLDINRLNEVIKLFDQVDIDEEADLLGQIYEFFLGKFFLDRGQRGGEFYTPKSIVNLIASILDIKSGKIYDPACGSGGMLIAAKKYVQKNNKEINDVSKLISVYGQESNKTTRNLAILNLVLNGLPIKNKIVDTSDVVKSLGNSEGDTFTNDQHQNMLFDYIMANPPFNLKEWFANSLATDNRFKYGLPPKGNANFAWIQHILSKLNSNGKAGVVLANGSLTSTTGGEDKIRENILNSNKVSCIIALPDKLFYTTGISACIWFFDNNKKTKDVLFIDAQNLGTLIPGSKKNKELTDENSKVIADIYHKFESGEKINIPGLAKSVSLEEIKENNYSLLPGRYIEINEEDKKDLEQIKKELKTDIKNLIDLIEESKKLEKDLLKAIESLNLEEVK